LTLSNHKDVEWFPLAENPQTESVHGVDAALEFVADWLEPWDELKIEVTQIMDAGDWVVIAGRQNARLESGAEISNWKRAMAPLFGGSGTGPSPNRMALTSVRIFRGSLPRAVRSKKPTPVTVAVLRSRWL
jgi:SnoaL-like domain